MSRWEEYGGRERKRTVRDRLEYWSKKLLIDYDGLRGSSVVTGALELSGKADLPGNFLVLPAYLFAAGQTGKTREDHKQDDEYFKEMPLKYRLPRYARRGLSTVCPWAAAFSLTAGIPPEYAATIPSGVYIVSELGLGKLDEVMVGRYYEDNPEKLIEKKEFELKELKGKLDDSREI